MVGHLNVFGAKGHGSPWIHMNKSKMHWLHMKGKQRLINESIHDTQSWMPIKKGGGCM